MDSTLRRMLPNTHSYGSWGMSGFCSSYPCSLTPERCKDDELPDASSVARRIPTRLHRQGRVAHPALEPPAPSSVRQAVLATIDIDPMKLTINRLPSQLGEQAHERRRHSFGLLPCLFERSQNKLALDFTHHLVRLTLLQSIDRIGPHSTGQDSVPHGWRPPRCR